MNPSLVIALLLARPALAQTLPANRPSVATPFDVMERVYKPFTSDEIGWALKVDAVSGSEDRFSRGTRELFYLWASVACADWARDPANRTWCHGDIHLGNAGVYVTDIPSERLAVGLTDFDEAYVGPFQMDLLCAIASLRLGAERAGLALTPARSARIARDACDAYKLALVSRRSATEQYGDDPRLRDLLVPSDKTLRDESEKHTSGGKYLPEVRSKKGELREVFVPLPAGREMASVALASAVEHSPEFGALAGCQTIDEWKASTDDAVLRRHIGSAGSQGMVKLLARVRAGVKLPAGHIDAAFYFKAQTFAAAERAGFATNTIPNGGQRVYTAMSAMLSPAPAGTSWAEMGGLGLLVEIRTPWNAAPAIEPDTDTSLTWATTFLAYLTGAAHAAAAETPDRCRELAAQVTPALATTLDARATAFIAANRAAFETWDRDPRVTALRTKAQAYLRKPNP